MAVKAQLMIVILLSALIACGTTRTPPPAAPAVDVIRPVAALPADLDVVVRIDLARIRQALGPDVVAGLRASALAASQTDQLLAESLSRADTVWLGVRPGLSPEHTDNVVVIRGKLKGLEPARPEWSAATDLGGAWRRYDRKRPDTRSAPARLYAFSDELFVFASTAELDSVERAIERGQNEGALEPPERGVLSLAARSAPLAESVAGRSPAAAQLLRKSRKLLASAELGDSELRAELELTFELEENARAAADAAGLLVAAMRTSSGALGKLADGISVEAVQATLVVRLRAPLEIVRALAA